MEIKDVVGVYDKEQCKVISVHFLEENAYTYRDRLIRRDLRACGYDSDELPPPQDSLDMSAFTTWKYLNNKYIVDTLEEIIAFAVKDATSELQGYQHDLFV